MKVNNVRRFIRVAINEDMPYTVVDKYNKKITGAGGNRSGFINRLHVMSNRNVIIPHRK